MAAENLLQRQAEAVATRQVLPKLLLTPRETAKALSLCEKTLWSLTKRGELQAVRIGRAVRYDPRDLTAWIERMKGGVDHG